MKTKGEIKLRPKAASVGKDFKKVGGKAWWYENAGSIDVVIATGTANGTYTCRIRRSQLADWIKIRKSTKREYISSCPDCRKERAAKRKSLTWEQVAEKLDSIKSSVNMAFEYAYDHEDVEASLREAKQAYIELKKLLDL